MKIQSVDGPQLHEACQEEQTMRSRITGGPTSRKLENHHKLRWNRNLEPRDDNNNRRRNNHHPNINCRNSSSNNNLTWKRLCHRSKTMIIDCHRWCQVGRRWFSCAPHHQRSKSYTPWFMETAPCLRPLVRKAFGIFMTCMQIWTLLIPVLPAKLWGKIRSLQSIRDISTNSLPSKDGDGFFF